MNPTLHSSAPVTQTSSPLAQFGWAIADAWIITRRDLMHWRLRPATVIMGWFFPVMIVLMVGLLLGWHWHAGMAPALAAVGLLLLLRFALLWVGIFFGLRAKGPESVTSVQILVWPISFLSNAFVDPSTMPPWLGVLAQWNPL